MNFTTLSSLPLGEAEFYLERKNRRDQYGMFADDRCWGISSDALVDHVFGLRREPNEWEYPADPSDLAACQRSYDMAPERLQKLMDPLMAKYGEHVEKRYPGAVGRVRRYLDTGVDA